MSVAWKHARWWDPGSTASLDFEKWRDARDASCLASDVSGAIVPIVVRPWTKDCTEILLMEHTRSNVTVCTIKRRRSYDRVNWWYLYGRSLVISGYVQVGPGMALTSPPNVWTPHTGEPSMLSNTLWKEAGHRSSNNSKSMYGSSWCVNFVLINQLFTSPLAPCVVKITGLHEHKIFSTKCFSRIHTVYHLPVPVIYWYICILPTHDCAVYN